MFIMPCKRFLNYNIQTNAPKSSFGFLRMRALARKQKRDCFERNLFKLVNSQRPCFDT